MRSHGLLGYLVPDEFHGSVVDIDLPHLWGHGIRAIIFDLDNTLVDWKTGCVSPDRWRWLKEAKGLGFKLCITSNNLSERVKTLSGLLGIPSVHGAVKPSTRAFRKALGILSSTPQDTALVGDQLFTDILGGNRMGFYTFLINPVSNTEHPLTRVVRCVERRAVRMLGRRGLLSPEQVVGRLEATSPTRHPRTEF